MRAREKVRLGALRLLLAAIKQKEVDERTTLDDTQVLAIVEKLSKQRRDSIEQFEKAGRTELAEQERAELAVLDTYRPAQADDAQIQAVIEAAVAETGAAGMADMGKVMATVTISKPVIAPAASDADVDVEAMEINLDMATSFIVMGKAEKARSWLDEVLESGSEAQKIRARSMLEQLEKA